MANSDIIVGHIILGIINGDMSILLHYGMQSSINFRTGITFSNKKLHNTLLPRSNFILNNNKNMKVYPKVSGLSR